MKLHELADPSMVSKGPQKQVLLKSHGVDKPLHKIQLNRPKSFKHFIAVAK